MIRFSCPACGAKLKSAMGTSGRKTSCPCGQPLIVPFSAESLSFDFADLHKVGDDPFDDSWLFEQQPPTRNLVHAPAPVFALPITNDDQPGFRCVYCRSRRLPISVSHPSGSGWVVFFILLLTCFPFCVIGLCIRDHYKKCADCGIRLG